MRTWRSQDGQLIVGVVLLLLVLSVLVPLMVTFTQREARWTAKLDENTSAFHLAEAGVEKAYRAITLSTSTWYALTESGTSIPQLRFDTAFDDVPGGRYAVSVTSGPGEKQATVISVGRDTKSREVRALKVIYTQSALGDIAILGGEGVNIGGGVNVEWGAVVSDDAIDTDGRAYPQFWSAASLDVDSDPTPPNCDAPDCCQWYSFSQDVPPMPQIDLGFYRSSAQASGTYYSTAQSWSNFTYTGGGTVFVENNLTVGSPGINVIGTLVVTGNMSTTSGNWGKGDGAFSMPTTAWKQYCNGWSHYRSTFDGSAPAAFPGINSAYTSSPTITYNPPGSKTAVQGLLYVGGNFSTSGGGGNSEVYGTFLVLGSVTINSSSGVTVYYNKGAASGVRTRNIIITRTSWQGIQHGWPSGL